MHYTGSRKLWPLLLACISVFMLYPDNTRCGEFRPYDAPSQSPRSENVPGQQGRQDGGKTIAESVYRSFEQDVAKMTPQQKADLATYFTGKRDQAVEFQEYKHYTRLLDILRKN